MIGLAEFITRYNLPIDMATGSVFGLSCSALVMLLILLHQIVLSSCIDFKTNIPVYWSYMPRVSRVPINKNLSKELEDHFATLISSLLDSAEIEHFFQEFLTREEKIMLLKRLMLHLMLENGYKVSEIKSMLGMSKETIRVHKNLWIRGGNIYKNIISKLARKEKTKRFWQKVEKILTPVNLALRAKTDMRARAKFASGQWFED